MAAFYKNLWNFVNSVLGVLLEYARLSSKICWLCRSFGLLVKEDPEIPHLLRNYHGLRSVPRSTYVKLSVTDLILGVVYCGVIDLAVECHNRGLWITFTTFLAK